MIPFLTQAEIRPYQGPERRATTRYRIQLPVDYRLSHDTRWRSARIVDMSARGLRIDDHGGLRPGSKLSVVIQWPEIYHGTPVRLFLTVGVLRVNSSGAALHILAHRFQQVRPVSNTKLSKAVA